MQRTEIKAAFSGIVQSRDVDPGDYVEVSDPIVTLVSDRSLDIFLEIPENLSGQVSPGMRVTPKYSCITQLATRDRNHGSSSHCQYIFSTTVSQNQFR